MSAPSIHSARCSYLYPSTQGRTADFMRHSISHIVSYIPIIGTICAIAKLRLINQQLSSTDADVQRHNKENMSSIRAYQARFTVEALSLGALFIIPDIIALIGRCLGISSTATPEQTWKSAPGCVSSHRTLKQLFKLEFHHEVEEIAVSPNGAHCVVIHNNKVYRQSITKSEVSRTEVKFDVGQDTTIDKLAITNDGTVFVAKHTSNSMTITYITSAGEIASALNLNNVTEVHNALTLNDATPVYNMVVDGDYLLFSTTEGKFIPLNWRTGECIETDIQTSNPYMCLALRNGTAVIAHTQQNDDYDLETTAFVLNLEEQSYSSWVIDTQPDSIAFLDDSTLIANADEKISLLTLKGKQIATRYTNIQSPRNDPITASKDANCIAFVNDNTLFLMRKEHPNLIQRTELLTHKQITALQFCPDGTLVAATQSCIYKYDTRLEEINLNALTTDEARGRAFMTLLEEGNEKAALQLVPQIKNLDLQVAPRATCSPLVYAVGMRATSVIRKLICLQADVNVKSSLLTPIEHALHAAADYGRVGRGDEWVEIIQLLIESGATLTKHMRDNPAVLPPILSYAIDSGSAELTRLLLKQDACSIEDTDNKYGWSMLARAINKGNLEVVQAMVENLTSIPDAIANDKFPDNTAILTTAIEHPEIYAFLESKGLINKEKSRLNKEELRDDLAFAALIAVTGNNKDVITWLCTKTDVNINFNYCSDDDPQYLLHDAAKHPDHTLVGCLTSNGASVDDWNEKGIYLLAKLAAQYNHLSAFNLVAEQILPKDISALEDKAKRHGAHAVLARLKELAQSRT